MNPRNIRLAQQALWISLALAAAFAAGLAPCEGEAAGPENAEGKRVNAPQTFWERDVWADPARPFLFYGEKKDEVRADKTPVKKDKGESLALFPADGIDRAAVGEALTRAEEADGLQRLTALKTVEELQTEVKARLNAAVMDPTPRAIGLYLQANAFMMQKAGVFAESWRRALVNHPQFDWTAVRPAVNAVSAAITREREGRMLREVKLLAKDHGLVFFGDDSLLTRRMLEQVQAFALENGFETAFVSTTDANPLMPQARPDRGLSRIVARGITQFPALVLVNRFDKDPARARLIATGAADGMTLARNTHAAALEMARERTLKNADERKEP